MKRRMVVMDNLIISMTIKWKKELVPINKIKIQKNLSLKNITVNWKQNKKVRKNRKKFQKKKKLVIINKSSKK